VTGDAETRSEFESMASINGCPLSSIPGLPGILNGTGFNIECSDHDAAGDPKWLCNLLQKAALAERPSCH